MEKTIASFQKYLPIQQAFDKEKVMKNMKTALAQIKASKQKLLKHLPEQNEVSDLDETIIQT